MASRASNFCYDAADPYAQTMWWAQVLEDFTLPEDLRDAAPHYVGGVGAVDALAQVALDES